MSQPFFSGAFFSGGFFAALSTDKVTQSGGGTSITFDQWLARHAWLRDLEVKPSWYAYPEAKRRVKEQIVAVAKEKKRVEAKLSFSKSPADLTELVALFDSLQERYAALMETYRAGIALLKAHREAEEEEEAEFMEMIAEVLMT